MQKRTIGSHRYDVTNEVQWRHRFTWLTMATTALLLAWGAFVTSIEAGMAFPDWPTSLGSYNLINPTDRWWTFLPYLAEHGHRLIASFVGFLTVVLAIWTWHAEARPWMRRLGFGALALVIAQGILGGLRVVFVSLDLALVHACVAQLFFATLVAMTLFTSRGWMEVRSVAESSSETAWLQRWTKITVVAVYVQIVLGAFLRQHGGGVQPGFAFLHVTGAFVVVGLVIMVWARVYKHLWQNRLLRRMASINIAALGAQFALGMAAYAMLLYETPLAIRSIWQIALTVLHVIVGAVLFGAAVALALLALRRPQAATAPRRSQPAATTPADATVHAVS